MRVLSFLVLVACGGQVLGSDGGTSSVDAIAPPGSTDGSTGYDFCGAMQTRAKKCNVMFDSAECAKTQACIDTAIRLQIRLKLETCLASNPCGTSSSDACLNVLAQPYATVPPFSTYAAKCATKRAACGTFPEDYCATKYAVGVPEVTEKMSACMDLACDGVPACFSSILQSYSCNN